MKIHSRTETHLLLAGIPGSAGWLVFALLLGLLFTAVFGSLVRHEYRKRGLSYPVVMCGLGVALGQLFFWTGAVTLAVGRESLELNKSTLPGTGGGRYRSRSPIVTVTMSFDFDLADVHAVSIERFTEPHRGGGSHGGGGSEVDVCRARLLINKPRRAVTLDETSNYRDKRVIAVGQAVAEFLGVPIKESDRRTDSE
jgi:hypothetical protein